MTDIIKIDVRIPEKVNYGGATAGVTEEQLNEAVLSLENADNTLNARIAAETSARETGDENTENLIETKAAQLAQDITNAQNAVAAEINTKLTNYLTEEETYSAIGEKTDGTLKFKGFADTRADLVPLEATVNSFDMYRIRDEKLDVYALVDENGTVEWEENNFTVDLSEYETTSGAAEKMNAAVGASKTYTDAALSSAAGTVPPAVTNAINSAVAVAVAAAVAAALGKLFKTAKITIVSGKTYQLSAYVGAYRALLVYVDCTVTGTGQTNGVHVYQAGQSFTMEVRRSSNQYIKIKNGVLTSVDQDCDVYLFAIA